VDGKKVGLGEIWWSCHETFGCYEISCGLPIGQTTESTLTTPNLRTTLSKHEGKWFAAASSAHSPLQTVVIISRYLCSLAVLDFHPSIFGRRTFCFGQLIRTLGFDCEVVKSENRRESLNLVEDPSTNRSKSWNLAEDSSTNRSKSWNLAEDPSTNREESLNLAEDPSTNQGKSLNLAEDPKAFQRISFPNHQLSHNSLNSN
jgi:hypothetical protein